MNVSTKKRMKGEGRKEEGREEGREGGGERKGNLSVM
jgi:hypothetical protein